MPRAFRSEAPSPATPKLLTHRNCGRESIFTILSGYIWGRSVIHQWILNTPCNVISYFFQSLFLSQEQSDTPLNASHVLDTVSRSLHIANRILEVSVLLMRILRHKLSPSHRSGRPEVAPGGLVPEARLPIIRGCCLTHSSLQNPV